MKKDSRKWSLLILALVLVAGVLFGIKEYFRTPKDMMNAKADWAGTENELSLAFEINENSANTKFLGKILLVTGVVDNISSEGDSVFNVMLGKSLNGKVSCTMEPGQNAAVKRLQVGDRVSIRGECAGYLADVELNRCVLVK